MDFLKENTKTLISASLDLKKKKIKRDFLFLNFVKIIGFVLEPLVFSKNGSQKFIIPKKNLTNFHRVSRFIFFNRVIEFSTHPNAHRHLLLFMYGRKFCR